MSVPLVATLAIVGALAVFVALAPNEASAQVAVPGQPMNLEAEADGPTRIELTWDESDQGGDAIGFRIDWSEDGNTWQLLESSHPDPRFVHEGLLARQTRHYRVFAFNSSGSSTVAGPISEITERSTKPDAPTGLSLATGAPPEEVLTLTWEPPGEPDGAPVTHYRIERSKNGTRWSSLEAMIAIEELGREGDDYTHVDDDLLEHQEWYYRVYAINSEGRSLQASNAPSASTNDGTEPAMPRALIAGVNPNSPVIWLYWDAPYDTAAEEATALPGAPITGYLVQGRPWVETAVDDEQLTFSAWSEDPTLNLLEQVGETTDLELTSNEIGKVRVDVNKDGNIDGNDKVTRWDFRVFAVNSVIERTLDSPTTKALQLAANTPTPFNASGAINVDTKAPNLLTPPTKLKADRDGTVNSGRTSIELEWKAPLNLGANLTNYRVEVSENRIDWAVPADDWSGADAARHDTLTGSNSNLIAGTKYYYRVFARQGADGDIYTWASHPVANEDTAPALRPAAPTLLEATTASHTQIDLMWTPPVEIGDGRITGYKIESSANGEAWSELVTIGMNVPRIYTFDDPTKKLTDRAGGADGVINFEHKGLQPGRKVHYRVSTINNAPANQKFSRPSSSVIGMTEPASEPDAPGGLVVQAYGQTAAKLCWNEQSAATAAAPTSGYRIDISDDEGETWTTLVEDTGSTDTIYTDMGLSAESVWHYRVYAINSVGTSPGFTGFDDGIDGTNDDDAVVTTDPATAPDAPVATATADSDTEITVTWTAPADGGSDITGWIVEKAYGGSFLDAERTNDDAFTDAQTWWDGLDCPNMVAAVMDDGTADDTNPFCKMYAGLAMTEEDEVERVFGARYDVIADEAQTNAMYSDLTPETAYMYRVSAVNAVGPGAWSNEVTATTLAVDTTQGEPSMVAATSSGGTITINWMPGANTASQVIVAVNAMDDTDYCLHVDTSGTLARHECPNLTPGQTYVVLIIALDGQGGYELGNVVIHPAN